MFRLILSMFVFALIATPAFGTPSVCDDPVGAVDTFLPPPPLDLSSDPQACRAQCDAVAKGCTGVAKGSGQCLKAQVEAQLNFAKAECGTLEGGEKQDCQNEVSEEQREFRAELREALKEANAICREFRDECRTSCDAE